MKVCRNTNVDTFKYHLETDELEQKKVNTMKANRI